MDERKGNYLYRTVYSDAQAFSWILIIYTLCYSQRQCCCHAAALASCMSRNISWIYSLWGYS